MGWVAILACFLTNELRLHLGILLSAKVSYGASAAAL